MLTGCVDRVRNIEALQLPVWPWMPAAVRDRIESHNAHCSKLSQAWAKHDETAAEVIGKVLAGSPLPTSAQLQEARTKLHNSAMACLKSELDLVSEDNLGPLLDSMQAACQAGLDDAISAQIKVEAQQIKAFLKANGFSSPEAAGPRLSIIEGQARNSQPCRDAAALIEECRQAGWGLTTQASAIRDYRAKRLQAVQKTLASELQAVATFANVPALSE